jgi:hypothetical protein
MTEQEILEPAQESPRIRHTAIAGLGIGLLLVVACAWVDTLRFLANWLVLFVFILTTGLGALFLVALEYTVKATWSVPFRRIAENLSVLIPISTVLALPMVLNIQQLYQWSHADALAADPRLAAKLAYLNTPFFLARLGAYYLVWLLFYLLFTRLSRRQDATGDAKMTRRGMLLGPPFLILFVVTLSFASIDWIMSLTPRWSSTMFGPCVAVSAIVSGLALTTLISAQLGLSGRLPGRVAPDHYYNLGALLFGLNTLWAYMAYSEYLLIWYGNLPAEWVWYGSRLQHGWGWISGAMILVRFAVPLVALLSRAAKMDPGRLRWISAWILVSHGLYLYWLVLPSVSLDSGPLVWLDAGFPVLALGILAAAWLWGSRRNGLIPRRDPRLETGLAFHL